jgi:N-acetylated-alpha-linked acidic dipeptidase
MPRSTTLPMLTAALVLLTTPLQDPGPLRGFTAEGSVAQRALEERFRAVPRPDSLRSYMRELAARPNHIGSTFNRESAERTVALLRSWGLDATLEHFEVLFPTPKERRLELVAPTRFVARLQEPAVPGDPTSSQQSEQLPTYNAYSVDGDVTGPLVFVNYGVPADYERLERMGVSVKGAIVIAKYGGSWRGIKPKVAAEHGAIGCIIYSDPKDDGYAQGDVYPVGPYRPRDGVQRGSVMDMPTYPGDPLTPGVGATADAKRLPVSEATTLTSIPVLPISYGDAQPMLAALGGTVVPEEWRGALPITYKTGPGPARVHLKVAFNWNRVTLNDIIIRIPGSTLPDEWVIRGNHRDGWVNGAADPISGAAALLEEARGLAALLKTGWRPRRTIIYALWDGEEQGLIGSTEWAETHAEDLRQHAVAYINTDGNGRGYLGMAGSHSLQRFINDVARDITDPETGLSVWKRRQMAAVRQANTAADRARLRSGGDLPIEALGSGSDFTPFLQHLGIATLNLGFGGEGGDGIYHSIYDDFSHYTRFSDTTFVYGRALSQTVGTAVLRLANADILPFQFTGLSETVGRYVGEVKTLLVTRREDALERNRQLDEGAFSATNDPREPEQPPRRLDVAPALNLAPLENALTTLKASAEGFDAAFAVAGGNGAAANAAMRQVEQALTSPLGLPRRPWYQHLLYAPGYYTGYGVKTLPGLREGIEQGQWQEAEAEASRIAERLVAAARLIDDAAAALRGGKPAG